MDKIKKAFKYLWDIRQKKIERIEDEARHPFAKSFDRIFNNPILGRRMVPRLQKHKKNLADN